MTRSRSAGFTLPEMVVVLLVLGVLARIAQDVGLFANERESGRSIAGHLEEFATAAEARVRANFDSLRSTIASSGPQVIDVATLKSANLLDGGYEATNTRGQEACAVVDAGGAGLIVIAMTTGGDTLDAPVTSAAADRLGYPGGRVYRPPGSGAVDIHGSSWQYDETRFSAGDCTAAEGHPAYRVTVRQGRTLEPFLSRVPIEDHPANRMEQELDMNANDIVNVDEIRFN